MASTPSKSTIKSQQDYTNPNTMNTITIAIISIWHFSSIYSLITLHFHSYTLRFQNPEFLFPLHRHGYEHFRPQWTKTPMISSKSHLDSDQFQTVVSHTPHTWLTLGSPKSTTSIASSSASNPKFTKATLFHNSPLSFPCFLGHHLLLSPQRGITSIGVWFFFFFLISGFF